MLHIGMDDTDSVEGGCTTWLATEVIKELSDFDLIDCPRLVRLNPNVPWKTRGNGAVSFTFGNVQKEEKGGGVGIDKVPKCYQMFLQVRESRGTGKSGSEVGREVWRTEYNLSKPS